MTSGMEDEGRETQEEVIYIYIIFDIYIYIKNYG